MALKIVKPTSTADPESRGEQPLRKRDIVARWGGDDRVLGKGFVAVPVLFLERMAQFKPYALTPAEALFIVCVMAHKWDERDPFPSYKRVATWMGKSESYVRRLAKNLATKGLVERQQRLGQTNAFDFKKLFAMILEPDASPQVLRPSAAKRKGTTQKPARHKRRLAS